MSYTELTVWTRGIIMDSACGPSPSECEGESGRGWGPGRRERSRATVLLTEVAS